MSKSATGSSDLPGRNVKAKSGLNKSVLDQGWGECGDENNADVVGAINALQAGTLRAFSARSSECLVASPERGYRLLACGEPAQSGSFVKPEPAEGITQIIA